MTVTRRRSAILLGAVVGAAALSAPIVPASAVWSGSFGATVVLATAPGGSPFHTETATLADGTTAVLWMPDGAHVSVRIRPRGSNTFRPAITYAAGAGQTLDVSGVLVVRAVSFIAAGPATFLAAWSETGPNPGVRVASIAAGATTFPAPAKVSGADATPTGTVVAAAPDGTAAALWFASPGGDAEVRVAKRVRTGPWSAPTTVGRTPMPVDGRVAIDVAGNATAVWLTSAVGGSLASRVRGQVAGAWAPTIVGPELVSGAFLGTPTVDVASGGGATTVALAESLSGSSGLPGVTHPLGIRILQRPTPSSPWSNGPLLTGPGRVSTQAHVLAAPDGSASVAFSDYVAAIGPAGITNVTTRLAERRGAAGAWSPARTVDAVTTSSWPTHATAWWGGSLAPDGALALVTMATVNIGGGTIQNSFSVLGRAAWGAPLSQRLYAGMAGVGNPGASLALAPSGRITVAWYDLPAGSTVEMRSTPLPRPTALVAAHLSTTAPRVGATVTCGATWADATSTSFRWLRSGKLISGATASTYRPRAADRTRTLACRAIAGNPSGSTVSTSIARKVR